ncbi:glyoxalase superfamily protein [Paenibacillus hexagrammi]|uniref:Bleomycin resistance protein n=1 Tax=Paenibacillus hexagrammi TaxID=2908839 RepID=A0ABY3SFE5_9BACL|nr:glyoxalase superfamily protein [Paenibacillus sp. YPD9-1]UJF31891.1 VOC family protein [Paenibacillus sp. YPD9-1]
MVELGGITPILRMFDVDKALHFYRDYLGFQIDWEHRFEPDLPLYMSISRDHCCLHLSEHYGDGSPGAHLRIKVMHLESWHKELLASRHPFSRPGLTRTPWCTQEMTLIDPFFNKLTFYEDIS